ncbi:SRPBCC domain-containing protein [Blastopirellula sp. J2-11]|uniref:SRPBCC domain-containing protein n=1 Tax=Blastopirellula sp. J2-11 TaxID=2943192 RepID=UPI0021C74406|nr:SRPBCC domain-containing protein [Blastopirellula sp. J2-11]UUO08881.1 SRPBCC domain-containing protein [Blastopirellula sp. J2-11]
MNTILSTDPKTDEGLVISCLIDAPRAAVFAAWTNSDYLAKWWGPTGFTNPVCQIDPTPGGAIYIEMCGPDGTIYPMNGAVLEVQTPSRFGFASSALGSDGQPMFTVHTTVDFDEKSGKTELLMRARLLEIFSDNASAALEGMPVGWSQTLDRLAAFAAGGDEC